MVGAGAPELGCPRPWPSTFAMAERCPGAWASRCRGRGGASAVGRCPGARPLTFATIGAAAPELGSALPWSVCALDLGRKRSPWPGRCPGAWLSTFAMAALCPGAWASTLPWSGRCPGARPLTFAMVGAGAPEPGSALPWSGCALDLGRQRSPGPGGAPELGHQSAVVGAVPWSSAVDFYQGRGTCTGLVFGFPPTPPLSFRPSTLPGAAVFRRPAWVLCRPALPMSWAGPLFVPFQFGVRASDLVCGQGGDVRPTVGMAPGSHSCAGCWAGAHSSRTLDRTACAG